ncbi:MAG TPA: CrcB family protein [Planctomycetota bacterium]|nr:CrcB family protein [Planctomycetota bacterium]
MTFGEAFSRALGIFAGAGIGGVLRYAVGAWIHRRAKGPFPWGTFAVNVTGCFAMGALMSLAESGGGLPESARTFLMTGILGGFTTFSAYGGEAEHLLRMKEGRLFLAYAGGSVLAGLAAGAAGRLAVGWLSG